MGETEKWNVGIELLRILCMLMIVMMHLLYKGGILFAEELSGAVQQQAWCLEAFCYVAVNCYVMISGWLLINSEKMKKNRAIELWLQTFLYSVAIGGISFLLFDEVSGLSLVKSVMPVLSNSYWFITNYLALYLIHPILNRLARSMGKKQLRNLLLGLLAVFCVWQNVMPFFETLDTSHGYSIIWFLVMYLTGAYLRLYFDKKVSSSRLIFLYIVCSLITFAGRNLCSYLGAKFYFFDYYTDSFYNYNSIPVFFAAVFLFLAFAGGMKGLTDRRRLSAGILFFSKVTLDVYLIHEQVILRDKLWKEVLPVKQMADSKWFLLIAAGIVLALYLLCSLIGQIRKIAFQAIGRRISGVEKT